MAKLAARFHVLESCVATGLHGARMSFGVLGIRAWPGLGVTLLVGIVVVLFAFGPARAADAPRPIDGGTQIFVDDLLIASKTGVVRRVHACEKLPEPVLTSREPWEQDGDDRRIYVYGTVLRDAPGGLLRLWYNRKHIVMLATSSDGVDWKRPRLGLFDAGPSSETNVVFPQFESPSIVVNKEAADPIDRYQMLGYRRAPNRGYYVAHSADGIHWELYPNNPILPGGDTCTLARNPRSGEYLAFHKQTVNARGQFRRLVCLATSHDMQEWSEPVRVMVPDEIDDAQVRAEGGRFSQFYNMSVFPHAGQFLGLVTHFRYSGPPAEEGPLQSGDDGPIDVQLVHSRDGHTWHRCEDRSPVIPLGPHGYDAGCILGVSNGPVLVDDQMWFYYTAITTTHGGYVPKKKITIARAAWRRDGLVSLDAGGVGGQITTVPLLPEGDRLSVNANATGGELRVAVLDAQGRPLPGYELADCVPLVHDAVRYPIVWKTHDRLPTTRPLRLEFHLTRTRLFSFAAEGTASGD